MLTDEIRKRLFELKDEPYLLFSQGLIPDVEMIGVRTPALKALAKEIKANGFCMDYLRDLPHRYFEENQLHSFLISEIREYETCIDETERFLPFIDNWATCDQLSPGVFKKNTEDLIERVTGWISDDHTYTVRFGLLSLMRYYLDQNFDPSYLKMAADINSEEYYINMMRAWFFATALAKQYEYALPYISEGLLDIWTHNKTISKACESRRIPDDRKDILRGFRKKQTTAVSGKYRDN